MQGLLYNLFISLQIFSLYSFLSRIYTDRRRSKSNFDHKSETLKYYLIINLNIFKHVTERGLLHVNSHLSVLKTGSNRRSGPRRRFI